MSKSPITLSVLDQSPVLKGHTAEEALQQTVKLAQLTEQLGYHRFWVSEHHDATTLAGSAPEVLISYLAAKTSTIRLGSGGVMLPHYSPYKVAESFRVLEGLAPGRIDLGLGRAPGGMPLATRALQEGKYGGFEGFPKQIEDLIGYIHGRLDDDHRFASLNVTPVIQGAPQLWMLGTSSDSARLAAQTGLPYAFAQFINGAGGVEYMKHYIKYFQPSVVAQEPHTAVAIFVICAPTEAEAEDRAMSMDFALLALESGIMLNTFPEIEELKQYPYTDFQKVRIKENRKRMIVGAPEQVKTQLEQLCSSYGTNEAIIVTITPTFEQRIESYQLLADVFELSTS